MQRGTRPTDCSAVQGLCLTLLMCVLATVPGYSGEDREECPKKKGIMASGAVNIKTACKCWAYEFQDERHENYDCEIIIERKGKVYRSWALLSFRGSDSDPVAHLKGLTSWRDGYLFVPYDGGGGTAWRGSGHHIFAIRDGELISSGSIAESSDGPEGFKNGLLHDVFAGLELNALTNHASSPRFTVVMRPHDCTFVADLDRTWEFNNGYYNENLDVIRKYLEKPECQLPLPDNVTAALLANAALTRYCNRDQELKSTISKAKNILSGKDFDLLREELYRVVPGQIPGRPLQEHRQTQSK